MTDRVYPSSKPQPLNGTTTATTNPSFPATKAQLYGATRPTYRPQPNNRRHRRSCWCSCCLWLTIFLLLLLLLVAIAGSIFYVLYHPHRPIFSVTALRISQLNLTSSSQLNTKLNLTLTARNPNKKLVFIYDTMSISLTSSHGVDVGDGTVPAFMHGTKNTTTLRTLITSTGQELDTTSVSTLKSDMKNKNGLPLKIQVNTKVKVKFGGLKTTKVSIRVSCDGIKATVPTGKSPVTATTSDSKCKVDLRIKIWKWTF